MKIIMKVHIWLKSNYIRFEDWMETKIAQTEQSITSVVTSFMYNDINEKPDSLKNVNFDEFIIGK